MDKQPFVLKKKLTDAESDDLRGKIFSYITTLMGMRNQLRVNHWETLAYEEHKTTDSFIVEIDNFVDALAESSMGAMGRPKIGHIQNAITDIDKAPTLSIVQEIQRQTIEMLELTDEDAYEGMNVLIGDFDAEIKKVLYLLTLT